MKNGKWIPVVMLLVVGGLLFWAMRYTEPGRQFASALVSCPTITRPTNTRLERAFKELKHGMTEEEVRAVVKKYTVEQLPDGKSSIEYVDEKVHKIGRMTPEGEVPSERWIDWMGDSYSDGHNWARDRAEPMKLHARFSADGHLYFATYQSRVEIRFPHDDLMLREDGVHPWNYAK